MIKKNAIQRILISTLAVLIVIVVYNYPQKDESEYLVTTNYVEAVKMPIYLLDENNYVSRISVLKTSDDVLENVRYIISTLTVGTEESEYISSSFTPIIPENTKLLTLSLTDGLLKINFSSDLLNVSEEFEVKLIESLVFSLCEFDEIDQIMIFVDGENLSQLPNSKIELSLTLDKSYGINKVYDITSFKNTTTTISYFLGISDDQTYYIPITSIQNSENEKIEIIIKNLQTSPINQTNLISYLKASATLEYYEILEESVLLSFNNELIADLSSDDILEEVQYSIYLSVRDSYDVQTVIFEDENAQILAIIE